MSNATKQAQTLRHGLFGALLALMMVLALLPATALAAGETTGTCGDAVTWTLDDQGTLTISGSGAMADYASGGAPWYGSRAKITALVIEEGVTSIGNYAFANCSKIASVTVPASVTAIGSYAFNYASALAEINLPESALQIGVAAFTGTAYYASTANWTNEVLYIGKHLIKANTSLSGAYTVKAGTLSIAGRAFYNCTQMTALTLPTGLKTISDLAFNNASGFAMLQIPASVTYVGAQAFDGAGGVHAISFLGNVPTIGDNAFRGVTALAVYLTSNATWTNDACQNYGGALTWTGSSSVMTAGGLCGANTKWMFTNDNKLTILGTGDMTNYESMGAPWYSKRGSATALEIREGVTNVGSYAFYNFSKITSVVIPDGVTAVGTYAFNNAGALASVTIPDTVTRVGNGAFQSTALYKAWNQSDEQVLYIGKHLIKAKTALSGSYTVAEGTLTVAGRAFYGCNQMTALTLPESLVSIGDFAFFYTQGLTTLSIPSNVAYIGARAFDDAVHIKEISFSGNAPTLGSSSFNMVSAIVTYPQDDATWTKDVMQDYGGALLWTGVGSDDLLIGGTCGEGVTWALSKSGTLTVSGKGAMLDYEFGEAPWYAYRNKIANVVIEGGVTYVGKNTFSFAYTNLVSAVINEGVQQIGSNSFSYNPSLVSITLPASIERIDPSAFPGTGYYLDESNWEGDALYLGNSLLRVNTTATGVLTVKEGTRNIAGRALYGCNKLTEVILPESVQSIGNYGFYYAYGITSVEIPANVQYVGRQAFEGLNKMKTVTFDGSAPATIGENAFAGVKATVSYPEDGTWTEAVRQNYGGTLVWEGYSNVTLFGITVASNPAKTTYTVGEALDTTGLILTATYTDGTTETVTEGFEVSGYDAATQGTQTITVTYEGKTATFTVSVVEEVMPEAHVAISSANAYVGRQVQVTVSVSDNPGLVSLILYVDYDSSVMTLTGVEDGGILGTSVHTPNLSKTPYQLTWENDTAPADLVTNGILATLTFTVSSDAEPGDYAITISARDGDAFDVDLNDVAITTTNGVVKVSASPIQADPSNDELEIQEP